MCGKEFYAKFGRNVDCSSKCQGKYKRSTYWKPLDTRFTSCFAGGTSEALAAYLFSSNGWYVFRAMDAYSPFDAVVFRNGILRTVEIRKAKLSRTERRVQFNRGYGKQRALFKPGTQWVALMIVEEQRMFVFKANPKSNFYDVSKAISIEIRTPNHPQESEAANAK